MERATDRCPPDRLGKRPERTGSRTAPGPAAGPSPAGGTPRRTPRPTPGSTTRPGGSATSPRPTGGARRAPSWAHDAFKSARGLTAVGLDGDATVLAWRIQGGTGDEVVRGPLNAGGCTKNRAGWYLPGFPDTSGSPSTCRGTGPARGSPGTPRRSVSTRTTRKTAVGAVDMPPTVPHAVLPGQPTNTPIMCVCLPMKSGDLGDDGP